ncbi:MAG: hypothetical protein ABGW82_02185 [Paracoccus sp. (in: a-proteobacteria)]
MLVVRKTRDSIRIFLEARRPGQAAGFRDILFSPRRYAGGTKLVLFPASLLDGNAM